MTSEGEGAGVPASIDLGAGGFATGDRPDSPLGLSQRLGASPPAYGYNAAFGAVCLSGQVVC